MAGQQYGKEWQRAQIVKRNAVRVKFEDLTPAVQDLIGQKGDVFSTYPTPTFEDIRLRSLRSFRGMHDLTTPLTAIAGVGASMSKQAVSSASLAGSHLVSVWMRTWVARLIQRKHEEIAESMKKFGVLVVKAERNYPPDWLNPTIVAQTHPIFSVTRNGDIIFRRVTPLEFKLLKAQEGWRGKAGLNISGDPRKLIWRWRGTLRKPLAPEVERKRVSERIREWTTKWKPVRARKPALSYARKPIAQTRANYRRR